MSDNYCPPPDPEDYLNTGIQYPTPEGKEWKKSTSVTHNDINFDDDKSNKNQATLSNVQDDADKARALKLQAQIKDQFSNKSNKSQRAIRTSGDRSVKSIQSVYAVQSNTVRKAVNEI